MAKINNDLLLELSKHKNTHLLEVLDKYITKCLEVHLNDNKGGCNKHELKGKCKGIWRLKTGDDNIVIIYTLEGKHPNRYALITNILSNKIYHNWIKHC